MPFLLTELCLENYPIRMPTFGRYFLLLHFFLGGHHLRVGLANFHQV